jgi:hypothetical protein
MALPISPLTRAVPLQRRRADRSPGDPRQRARGFPPSAAPREVGEPGPLSNEIADRFTSRFGTFSERRPTVTGFKLVGALEPASH